MGNLRHYTTSEQAMALLLEGEGGYWRMCNLEGLASRGFEKGYLGMHSYVHRRLGISVDSLHLTHPDMLRQLDRMIADKERGLIERAKRG